MKTKLKPGYQCWSPAQKNVYSHRIASAFTKEHNELNGWEKKNKIIRKNAVSDGLAYNPVAQSKY